MHFVQHFTLTRDFDKEKDPTTKDCRSDFDRYNDESMKKYHRSEAAYWIECYKKESAEALKSLERAKHHLLQA